MEEHISDDAWPTANYTMCEPQCSYVAISLFENKFVHNSVNARSWTVKKLPDSLQNVPSLA